MAQTPGPALNSSGVTYLVIDDDDNATLTRHNGSPTVVRVEEHLRGRGWNRIYPNRHYGMCGWASDVGLVSPDVFARNPVASCVAVSLGAPAQPYAGPIVFTGYAYDQSGDPEAMGDKALDMIDAVYRQIRAALGMPAYTGAHLRDLGPVDPGDPPWLNPDWVEGIRAFASEVREGPTPGMTVTGIR